MKQIYLRLLKILTKYERQKKGINLNEGKKTNTKTILLYIHWFLNQNE